MNTKHNNMKSKMMIIAVGMLIVCLLPLAAFAQQQDWQTTSTMKTSGSAYSPQVTAVGAAVVEQQATTTESYSPSPAHKGGIRRSTKGDFDDSPTDNNKDEEHSPLGDAVWPLMLMALAYLGVRVLRARKRALNG